MTSDLMQSWVFGELAYWLGRFDKSELSTSFDELNRKEHLYLFDINNGEVCTRDKLIHNSHTRGRIALYERFLKDVVSSLCPNISTTICFCGADWGYNSEKVPIFSFQKRRGGKNILFPDIDFLRFNFYQSERDDIKPFHEKTDTAIFAGSTSGSGTITLEKLRGNAVPRINSARFFKEHPFVKYVLPSIVQVASDEVRDAIIAMGLGGQRLSLDDQLESKFLISVDGNGATCSRVVHGLMSNSVLLKYHSEYVLYYFSGLIPWMHYVPVHSDNDVVTIVEAEKHHPSTFAKIALQSRQFYESFMTKEKVYEYTSMLITEYARHYPPVN